MAAKSAQRAAMVARFAEFLPPGLAAELESSCYNAAIVNTPPHTSRTWANPAFVGYYAARCGVLLGALDPGSETCRAHGAWLAGALKEGRLTPREAGALEERALCPSAFREIQEGIAKRRAATYAKKWQTLYECPACHQTMHTMSAVQKGSLDEATSYLCVCVCGKAFERR